MLQNSGLMQGKRGVILGVANNRSIAWGIAKACHAAGAEIALTWQGDALNRAGNSSNRTRRINDYCTGVNPNGSFSGGAGIN